MGLLHLLIRMKDCSKWETEWRRMTLWSTSHVHSSVLADPTWGVQLHPNPPAVLMEAQWLRQMFSSCFVMLPISLCRLSSLRATASTLTVFFLVMTLSWLRNKRTKHCQDCDGAELKQWRSSSLTAWRWTTWRSCKIVCKIYEDTQTDRNANTHFPHSICILLCLSVC